MKTLPESILEHSRRLPEGGLVSPKEFLHLGSRAAVDQAFSRLAKGGQLIRAARGLYLASIKDQYKQATPLLDKVVSSLASKNQEEIVFDGLRSAEILGLSPQVPDGQVFLTTGRTRTLTVGGVTAKIRHAPRWMLALGSTTGGAVIRALAWLGERRIGEVMETLRKQLTPIDWQALSSVRSLLPSWMALAIGREVG
ncbi:MULTISPECIES: DUF6088 family protein [Pseudomonas syringae group]|uniref:Type IV toxin-antitoxin system AbiEi family antitoxin domain-containing protein n=3 Tax=Pseudomonas syringae group TaxID=136849 RepID=A0ABX4YTI6_9PSED|nr:MULTISPECIES: DUF6088 family protein [Pseudomonas syringae group]KWS62546.1 hypothetical protein AL055_26495 [Pseudomonas amygdali pv. morsprunorum]MCQ3017402.1 DUF6088 family protein [Pseudomonas tremae]POC86225.1 hypothetical protein BKM26_20940 [Pseudomonas avellanae]POD07339.1 hypothetical protein BKM20_16775 [Pseudomonas avellanae]QGL59394.1 hypothetical protein POR16_25215 [Pseudomonas coronafaciens pv. oryzae str. 1_6]